MVSWIPHHMEPMTWNIKNNEHDDRENIWRIQVRDDHKEAAGTDSISYHV